MTKHLTPLQSRRKLLRSLYHLRALSRRARGRMPLRFLFKAWRRRLVDEVAASWDGGYILSDDEFFYYVPRQFDTNGLDLLTRELVTESVIARHCPAGGVALDVGAHLGTWTLPMARAVGETGRVHAFEPIPFLNEALRKTALANGLNQVALDGRALGSAAGSSNFTIARGSHGRGNLGMSGLGERPDGGETIQVEVTTLDSFALERRLDRLDFVKIDVEGLEAQVLAGGGDTLGRFHPAIVFETGHEDRDQRHAIYETLRPLGYRLIGIPVEHGIVEADWDAFVAFSMPFTPTHFCNVLCVAD